MANKKSVIYLQNPSTNEYEPHHFETEVDQIVDMTSYMKELNKTITTKEELQNSVTENMEITSNNISLSKNKIIDVLGYEPATLETIKAQVTNIVKTNQEIQEFIKNNKPKGGTTYLQCNQCTETQCKQCNSIKNTIECSQCTATQTNCTYSCSCSCGSANDNDDN